jgi:branched-chain amino acid transport system ATP-binding protein
MLEINDIYAGYNEGLVLEDVTMTIEEGSITSLLGRNGVGKTTTLRVITGLLEPDDGTVVFRGEEITGLESYQIHSRGIGMVMEDRGMFTELTVDENLKVPVIDDFNNEWTLEDIYDILPALSELQTSEAGNLSGGEQQMLSFGRALRSGPDLLLLDESTEGLAPQIVESIAETIERIASKGTTVLLVEQNVQLALELASYHYVMDSGRIVMSGSTEEMRTTEAFEEYLGFHGTAH